jgi:hypothetical protein
MSSLLHRSRRYLACLAALTPLLAASAAHASAGPPAGSTGSAAPAMAMQSLAMYHNPCDDRYLENPFTQWGDYADYFLIRGGNLDAGGAGWAWGGGGGLYPEDNAYTAYPGDPASAGLTSGQSATSPPICVSIDDPTLRFFVRNKGASTGTLTVQAAYTDVDGNPQAVTLGTLTSSDAGDAWSPSPILDLTAPLHPQLDADGYTPVNFQFTAHGDGSSWLVDDVYVDPYGKG